MDAKRRTLFSVIEVVDDSGRHFEADWHPDLYDLLNDVSPNGELTDKLIGFAEELIEDDDNLDD